MKSISLTPLTHKDWDRFCLESDDAWFWHTTDWIEHILIYKPERKSQNLSFFVCEGETIKAVVPLILETHQYSGKNVFEFSFGSGYGGNWIPVPALANDLLNIRQDRVERDMVCEFIFREVDRLAYQHSVMRITMEQSSLSPSFLKAQWPSNHLMRFGYNDISMRTQLIDLRKTEEELWNALRRNHKRNIKKGGDFIATMYTSQNITTEVFEVYKQMHHRAAGRKTRPDQTFYQMYDWIIRGRAFLMAVEYKGNIIGCEHYVVYKNNVYGISSANDPEYSHLPVRHFLEWEAILWMKRQQYTFYEIGLQQYGTLLYDYPDKKQLDISHFKRGFGGFPVPLFAAEKFYNKKYLSAVYEERINTYATALNLSH